MFWMLDPLQSSVCLDYKAEKCSGPWVSLFSFSRTIHLRISTVENKTHLPCSCSLKPKTSIKHFQDWLASRDLVTSQWVPSPKNLSHHLSCGYSGDQTASRRTPWEIYSDISTEGFIWAHQKKSVETGHEICSGYEQVTWQWVSIATILDPSPWGKEDESLQVRYSAENHPLISPCIRKDIWNTAVHWHRNCSPVSEAGSNVDLWLASCLQRTQENKSVPSCRSVISLWSPEAA